MKRALNEATVKKIYKTLVERFGEPIGQAVEVGPGEQVKTVAPEEVKKVRACPICKGSGRCDGTGTRHQKIRMKCPACRGRGFMDVKPPTPTTESVNECAHCGNIPRQITEGMCCDQCGMMPAMEEAETSGRHPGHATGCTCPDCSRPESEDLLLQGPETELDEKTPPGREKQVKALKKNKDIDNPWAVAWSSYNKKH